jgi:hypothetical protein
MVKADPSATAYPFITWFYTYVYYRGINVSGEPDHVCVNGAAPSGEEVVMEPGDSTPSPTATTSAGSSAACCSACRMR